MKIRELYATASGNHDTIEILDGGIDVVADDGRTLYSIRLLKDGSLEIGGGLVCKHGGKMLDDQITIKPISYSSVVLTRPEYN